MRASPTPRAEATQRSRAWQTRPPGRPSSEGAGLQLGGDLSSRDAGEVDQTLELGGGTPRRGGQADRPADDAVPGLERHGDAAEVLRELLEVRRVPARTGLPEMVLEHRAVGDRPPGVRGELVVRDVVADALHA